VDGVYTYGQPRIGDSRLQLYMNKVFVSGVERYHRFVNVNDVVPHFLPGPHDPFAMHYCHFACERYIDQHDDTFVYPVPTGTASTPDVQSFVIWTIPYLLQNLFGPHAGTMVRRLFWVLLPQEINDHFPLDYAAKIRKNLM